MESEKRTSRKFVERTNAIVTGPAKPTNTILGS